MQLEAEEISATEISGRPVLSSRISKTPEQLTEIVSRFASSHGWIDRVRLNTERRWYERLYQDADYDIWVISWMPGQATGFHDHGESSGAFVVASGELEEHRPGEKILLIPSGASRAFGPDYAHDVRNASAGPAISIHAYSPPLSEMNEYELDGADLIQREHARRLAPDGRGRLSLTEDQLVTKSIDQILAAARARLRRLSPDEAFEAIAKSEAVLVDIRPESQRESEGYIPGALIVERNVLEWRFDPTSESRLPVATDHELQVIVFCSEGYTSSLAATALQDLGIWRATDIAGGFSAWREAGLPASLPARSP